MRQFAAAIFAGALVSGLAIPAAAAPADFAEIVADQSRLEEHRALDESRQPAAILDFSGFEEGEVVADFLGGTGYFSTMIGEIVGDEGRVYAMNPVQFHDSEKWAAATKGETNLRALVAPVDYLLLPPNSVDVIFTHLTFHDLYWESERNQYPRLDVPSFLANWRAALRPGGTVIVVDHHGPKGDTREIVAKLHRMDRDQVVTDMRAAGFELIEESDVLQRSTDDINVLVFDASVRGNTSRYMLKFRKL